MHTDDPSAPGVRSPSTDHALHLCRVYAPARITVAFVGETGTGKSHFARILHDLSPRRNHPFIDVTAAELLDGLAADLLFGHEPGAYTSARGRRLGLFAEASDGSLLLDELHLLPVSTQALLLRALATGAYRPLGAERDRPVRCRVLVGLRDCPDALMRAGLLLPDLRFRLGHCIVRLARLEDRRDEIAGHARKFLSRCPDETGAPGPPAMAAETIAALEAAAWPGNLRDLRASIEAAFLHAAGDDCIRPEHLPAHAQWQPSFMPHGDPSSNDRAIAWALWKSGNRVGDAAALIGAHRNTVSKYVTRHDTPAGAVTPPMFRPRAGTARR